VRSYVQIISAVELDFVPACAAGRCHGVTVWQADMLDTSDDRIVPRWLVTVILGLASLGWIGPLALGWEMSAKAGSNFRSRR
jgi:hypothetical protein